ncbi:unnamed protein product [Scytosiphon promiscuus]
MSMTQEAIVSHLPKPSAKLAKIPNGTPTPKSWHVERRQVLDAVFEGLTGDGGPRLVGLVGDSGSGKTTVASEIVRSTEVRQAFSDGIVWLTVNDAAKGRLPSLMLQLARTVYTNIGGSVGRRPAELDDGVAYVKQCMENGHGGKGLRCLVVADNVWEKEVVSKLLETGMSILLSTRCEELVVGSQGTTVRVDEMSEADAELVLRKAAELPSDVRLPDDAVDLIELCGHVAMDLAFVGRWSTVRGREDRTAWSGAVETVRAEMKKADGGTSSETASAAREKRRKAILRAGFDDLGIGSDDDRVQRLYLSLAVMPDGHAFTARDATVLLHDRLPSAEDETSAAGVVGVLERWSVIGSTGNAYRMHDAHSSFARENIIDRGDVRRRAVKRWSRHISTLDAVRSIDARDLKGLWQAVEGVGGDGWAETRPYVKALAEINETGRLLRESIEAVGWFQAAQEDFEGASTTWRLLLEVEKRELGADHPYVLNSYHLLADLADRLGDSEKATEWRERELEALPVAVAKVKKQLDVGEAEAFNGAGPRSVAGTMMRLTPGDRDEAEVLLRRWLRIQEAKLGPEAVEVVNTLHELGFCVTESGRLEEAEELLRRCLGVREAKLGPEDMEVANTLYQLGFCVQNAGRLEEAEEFLRRCLGIREAKLGPADVEVANTLYQLGLWVRESGRLEEAEELLRRCLGIREAELGLEDVEVAKTLYQLGLWVQESGRLEEAEELLRRCLGIEEAKLGPEDVEVAKTLYQLGLWVQESGRLEEAEELLRRCLGIREAKLGPEDVEVANTLYQLGVWVRESGRLEEAEELLRRCLGIEEAKLGPEDMEVANTLYQLGLLVRESGRLEEAEELLRRCLGIEEAKLGPEDVEVAKTLYQLGLWVRESGRFKKAEELLRRCLGIREAKLGPEDMGVSNALYQLGAWMRRTRRLEEAEELLRRCLGIREAKLGPEDVGVANTLYQLGFCVRKAGRLEEAEELLRRCLGIFEAKLGPEDVEGVNTLYQLGVWVRESGRLEEAEELLRRCLGVREAKLGPEDMGVATTLYQLGSCVRESGRLEEAEELLRRCLGIREAKLGPEDVEVAKTLYQLGLCVRESGRLEEAEELLRRCLGIKHAKLDPESVDASYTLLSLGICLHKLARLEEAEELFLRCLTIREAKLAPQNVLISDALHYLGICVREAGRWDEAERLLRRSLAIRESSRVCFWQNNVTIDDTLNELDLCDRMDSFQPHDR